MESRIASTLCKVKVKSQICIERKVPFATAGLGVENGFREYMNDLKLVKAVQGCSGVSKFIGVVLDDTRTHLEAICTSTRHLVPFSACYALRIVETKLSHGLLG